MSLTVTLPTTFDAASLRQEIVSGYVALQQQGLIYNVDGDQLTIENLQEINRNTVEGIISAHSARMTERQSVIAAYTANQQFIAKSTVSTAEAVAQVKALTQQINYIAKALFDKGII